MEQIRESRKDLGIVWGAGAIAQVIGVKRPQAYYLLKNGLIKSAGKLGKNYYASIDGLRAQFCGNVSSK